MNPWCHWPNPQWKFNTESSAGHLQPPDDVGLANANSVALPAYLNTVAAPMPFFAASSIAERPLPMGPRHVTTLAPSFESPAPCPSRKRPPVLYQKETHGPTAAPLWRSKGPLDPVPELQGSNETNVTDVGAEETEGVRENTDEIDALLDSSDSDEGRHELDRRQPRRPEAEEREDPRDRGCAEKHRPGGHRQGRHGRSRRSHLLPAVSEAEGQDAGSCLPLASLDREQPSGSCGVSAVLFYICMECRQASGNKVKDAGDHLRFWRCFRTRNHTRGGNNGEKGKKKGPMVLALLLPRPCTTPHHKAPE